LTAGDAGAIGGATVAALDGSGAGLGNSVPDATFPSFPAVGSFDFGDLVLVEGMAAVPGC